MSNTSRVDFLTQKATDWKENIDQLFPQGVPTRAYWTDLPTIISVLNHVGSVAQGNYTFFASGGGLTLGGAKPGTESGTIELQFQGAVCDYVCKPAYLVFESFPDKGKYEWYYFRLETQALNTTGVGYVTNFNHGEEERVTEMYPGQYESLDTWAYRGDRDEDDPLPSTARQLTRLTKGGIVVFQKMSLYDATTGTDSGVHAKHTPEEFRKAVEHAQVYGAETLWTPPAL